MRVNRSDITVLVTATGGPAGLAALRSLQETGRFNLIATDADPLAPSLYIQNIKTYVLPMANDKKYIEKLIEICRKNNVKIILPCSDEEICILSKKKNLITNHSIELPIPNYNTVMKARDKWITIKTLAGTKINLPKTFAPNNLKELKTAVQSLGLPIVVRPRVSRGARGIHYCYSKAEAVLAFKQLRNKYKKIIVQEFIPGSLGSVYVVQTLFNKHHVVIAASVMQKLREKPPTGGVATAGKTVHNKELLTLGVSAIEKIGSWVGPAGIEFKINSRDGKPYLMEVNPRLQGVTYLFTRAGINFPYLWTLIALGENPKPKFKYVEGLYFSRLWNDLTFNRLLKVS